MPITSTPGYWSIASTAPAVPAGLTDGPNQGRRDLERASPASMTLLDELAYHQFWDGEAKWHQGRYGHHFELYPGYHETRMQEFGAAMTSLLADYEIDLQGPVAIQLNADGIIRATGGGSAAAIQSIVNTSLVLRNALYDLAGYPQHMMLGEEDPSARLDSDNVRINLIPGNGRLHVSVTHGGMTLATTEALKSDGSGFSVVSETGRTLVLDLRWMRKGIPPGSDPAAWVSKSVSDRYVDALAASELLGEMSPTSWQSSGTWREIIDTLHLTKQNSWEDLLKALTPKLPPSRPTAPPPPSHRHH